MATRYNPYALDPALSAGIGNLTKALIGSASDDAAIARGRASDALAGYRQAQTRGENLRSDYLKKELERQKTSMSDNELVNSIFSTLGLPTQRVEQGEDVATSPGMATAMGVNQGQSIPFNRTVPINYDPEAIRSLVGSSLFGGVPGNPQQSSEMGLNLQEMTKNNLARNLLLASNQSPDRIAAILGGVNPGKYFDQGSARELTEIEAATDIEQTKEKVAGGIKEKELEVGGSKEEKILELSAKKDMKAMELKSEQEIATEKEKALAAFREFKVNEDNKTKLAEQKIINENDVKIEKLKLQQKGQSEEKQRELEKKIAELEEKTKLKIAKMKDDTVRFKFENEPVTITKKPGEKYVLDPKLGQRLQISPNDEGLYVVDGGIDNSKVKVKVGKEDIYLTKDHAKLLGIEPNADGKYVIEGAGFPDASMTDAKKFDNKFKADYEAFADTDNRLDPGRVGGLRAYLQKRVESGVIKIPGQPPRQVDFAEAYNHYVIPVLNAGNITIRTGSNFNFPKLYFDQVKAGAARGASRSSLIKFIKSLGFNQSEASRVYQEATE